MYRDWIVERALVRRAIAGDREAAERLVAQHYPSVIRFLLHLTGHINEAEELAQETFVKAWQRLGAFEGRASLRTWLHRIAYREYAVRRNLPEFAELPDEQDDRRQCFVGPLVEAMAMERAIVRVPRKRQEQKAQPKRLAIRNSGQTGTTAKTTGQEIAKTPNQPA